MTTLSEFDLQSCVENSYDKLANIRKKHWQHGAIYYDVHITYHMIRGNEKYSSGRVSICRNIAKWSNAGFWHLMDCHCITCRSPRGSGGVRCEASQRNNNLSKSVKTGEPQIWVPDEECLNLREMQEKRTETELDIRRLEVTDNQERRHREVDIMEANLKFSLYVATAFFFF